MLFMLGGGGVVDRVVGGVGVGVVGVGQWVVVSRLVADRNQDRPAADAVGGKTGRTPKAGKKGGPELIRSKGKDDMSKPMTLVRLGRCCFRGCRRPPPQLSVVAS